MGYDVELVEAPPQHLASLKRKGVPWNAIPAHIRPMFDRVYEVLRAAGGTKGLGHNVCVYSEARREGFTLEVGVITAEPWAGGGDVAASTTPHGRAARTVHTGDYGKLGAAHDAAKAWIEAQGLKPGAASWEVYGDWNEDPAKITTEVYWLVD